MAELIAIVVVEQDDAGGLSLAWARSRRRNDDCCRSRRRRRIELLVGLVARQEAAHSSHELGRMEWLDEVVVRPRSESLASSVGLVLR